MQYGTLRADRCPRIVDWFDNKYIFNIVTAGLSKFYIKSSKHTKSEHKQSSIGRPVPRIQKNQKH